MKTYEDKQKLTPKELTREAIRLSVENVEAVGGPFGAVIARDGKIVATGTNRVTPDCDPTAHAEIGGKPRGFAYIGAIESPPRTWIYPNF